MNPGALPLDASITTDEASLLPVQYGETVRPASAPEARLMAAVLRRAITDFRQYASDDRPLGKHLHRLASEWIASSDVRWPYSFENICRTFDLDPHGLRRSLVRNRAREARAAARHAAQTIVLAPRDGTSHRVWEATAAQERGGPRHPSAAA